jgi:hypothetical protein
VTITCRASTHSAGTPALSSERPRDGRRGSLPWHYHVEHARRDLAQNGKRADEVEELIELRVDLSGELLPFGTGRELASGRDVPRANLLNPRARVVRARLTCGRRDAEQTIGYAAHRRDDDRRAAAVARPRRPHDVNQALDGCSVGDRGPAEFLNNHATSYKLPANATGYQLPAPADSHIPCRTQGRAREVRNQALSGSLTG